MTPPASAPPSSATAALAWLRDQPLPATRAETLAYYVHALLLSHGFRPSGTPLSASGAPPSTLPAEWGAAGYGGRYAHARSSLTFDIRATAVGARLVVHGVALEDPGEMHTLPLEIERFVGEGEGWAERLARREDVATVVQVQIAHRLVPDAAKEGYEQAASAREGAEGVGAARGANGQTRYVPVPMAPGMGVGGEEPLRIGGVRRPGDLLGVGGDGAFGRDDLVAPGLPDVGGGFGGVGGNLMGPRNFPGRMGVGRGLRPQGVPPGARFDPYTPFGPDNDMERPPGWEDEHGLGGGMGGGMPFGGGMRGGRPFGGGSGGMGF